MGVRSPKKPGVGRLEARTTMVGRLEARTTMVGRLVARTTMDGRLEACTTIWLAKTFDPFYYCFLVKMPWGIFVF